MKQNFGIRRGRRYFQIYYLSCGCLRACICDENARWGPIPDPESLLHASTVRLRSNGNRWVPRTPPITPPVAAGGESGAGGRADTTYLPRIRLRKSQEKASVVLWRSFSSHACGFQGFRDALAAVRRPLAYLPRMKEVLSRSNVGTLGGDIKPFCKRI